jgi:hypothetical protein
MKGLEGDDVWLTSIYVHFHCVQQQMQFLKEFGICLTPLTYMGYVLQTSYVYQTFIDQIEVCQETKVSFQSGKQIPICLQ